MSLALLLSRVTFTLAIYTKMFTVFKDKKCFSYFFVDCLAEVRQLRQTGQV